MATRSARLAQALRGDRGIVEEAEAAGDIGEGVVARRPAERIGRRCAGHRPPRLRRPPSRRSSRSFRRSRPRSGRMCRPCGSRPGRPPTPDSAPSRAIGWMFGITSAEAPSMRCQRSIDVLQELDIFGRVDGGDRAEAVDPSGARSRSRRPSRRQAAARRAPALPDWVSARRRTGTTSGRGAAVRRRRRLSWRTPPSLASASASAVESVVIGGMDLLGVGMLDADARVERLGAVVSGIDRQAHVAAAALGA